MRDSKRTSINNLLTTSFPFKSLFTSLLLFGFSTSYDGTVTETVFETVPNPLTITSYYTASDGCLRLPTCIIVNGSAIFPSGTNSNGQSGSGTATSATTTTLTTFTGQPDVGFVLYGDGELNDHYVQFDDVTGRFVFAEVGTYRFVQLQVNDGGTGLLQNGLNLTELVFLRYNSTVRNAYPAESAEIVDIVQEVRHASQDELLATDIMGTWGWNATDGQLGLQRDGDRWVFYVGTGPSLRARQIPNGQPSFDVFVLPQALSVPSDSAFQRLLLGAAVASDFPSSLFTESPTATQTGSATDTSGQLTRTGTNSNGSGTGTRTGTRRTGSATRTGTSGRSNTRSNTGTITNIRSTGTFRSTGSSRTVTRSGTTASGTGTGTSTGTGNTGTITSTGTGTGGTETGTGSTGTETGTGGTGTGTGGSSGGTAEIYSLITQYNLQQYCTELLSFFSPTWPTTISTTSYYSTSTDLVTEFTETATTYTNTAEVATSTGYVAGTITTAPTLRRRTKTKTIRGSYKRRRVAPDTPAQLSGYPADSISAACVEAATSPTAYIYQFKTISTYSPLTTTTDLTQTNTVSDIFTTTTGDVAMQTIPAIGNFKLVHSDLSDTSGTYYGWYVHYIAVDIPVKVKQTADTMREALTQIFYDVNGYPILTWSVTGGTTSFVWFEKIGATGANVPTTDTVTNYRLANYDYYTGADRKMFAVTYNFTSYEAKPDGSVNPVTSGRFYMCDTETAYANLGFFDLYYGPSDFSSKSGYSAGNCKDTGMDALWGEDPCKNGCS
ncbi:hypothetical protein TWF730_004521 [Orbilia blumenaviensis]|uniref:Uncharacterized protein n=1 Tax=Orbilia blumenaviensis TaxID=1796055 RepID=A0AAV9TYX4_9PEZI